MKSRREFKHTCKKSNKTTPSKMSHLRKSKASGSTRRRIEDIIAGRGKYSQKSAARRQKRQPPQEGA